MLHHATGSVSGIGICRSRGLYGGTHARRVNCGATAHVALYMPTSEIVFSGNSTTVNGCTQVIGLTVEFTGNSTLRSTCTTFDAPRIETNVLVSLVE